MPPLDVILRNRVVCGLRNVRILQRLFAEQDSSFKMIYDIAFRVMGVVKQQQDLKFKNLEYRLIDNKHELTKLQP